MRRVVFLFVVGLLFAPLADPVYAAAPGYILITGRDLARPILLDDLSENFDLYQSPLRGALPVARKTLLGRPSFDMALFWGAWEQEARTGRLRARDADQHGRFWPAVGAAPAVIQLPLSEFPGPRLADPVALRILQRHEVPLRFAECGRAVVGEVLRAFVNAFNRGKLGEVDQLFARASSFRRYSVGPPAPRLPADASDRSTLLRYVEARHRQHEFLRLLRFGFTGTEMVGGAGILGHFMGVFMRKADDVPRTRRSFTGTVACGVGSNGLVVLNIA